MIYDDSCEAYGYISQDRLTARKNFYTFYDGRVYYDNTTNSLAINHKDGSVYLITGNAAQGILPILRFSSVETALKVRYLMAKEMEAAENSSWIKIMIIRNTINKRRIDKLNKVYQVRQKILKGYPSKYRISANETIQNLFDLCAKQKNT